MKSILDIGLSLSRRYRSTAMTLGASRADVGQTGEESWVVLADPEGNEFCVVRSLAPGHFSL